MGIVFCSGILISGWWRNVEGNKNWSVAASKVKTNCNQFHQGAKGIATSKKKKKIHPKTYFTRGLAEWMEIISAFTPRRNSRSDNCTLPAVKGERQTSSSKQSPEGEGQIPLPRSSQSPGLQWLPAASSSARSPLKGDTAALAPRAASPAAPLAARGRALPAAASHSRQRRVCSRRSSSGVSLEISSFLSSSNAAE